MTTSPHISGTQAIRPLLRQLGLEDKEIEIYLALLPLKMARASTVAKAARQSRSHTYLILRELKERGLVSEIERGKIIHFVAELPKRLLGYLEDRVQKLEDLRPLVEGALPLLDNMKAPLPSTPRVTTLSGLSGMRQVYREILVQEFVGIYNPEVSYKTFGGNIVTILFGEDAIIRGRDLLVDNEGSRKYLKEVPMHEGYDVRLLPKGISFDTDTVVFGNTVALFAFDDEKTIVRIENKHLADTFRAWFEVMWGAAVMSDERLVATR